MIENDNTYAKSCILYSKDVYISVTQSKYILVCVCACVCACARARACVRAYVRAYVHTCVRFGAYKWSIQMCTLVFVLAVVEFSAKVHPFRIC